MLAMLRNRDFLLLWTGQLLSNAGGWLLLVAVPYRVFQLTGSPAATGFAFVAGSVPSLVLGPIAGILVDRWDRRRTMLAVDLGRAASILPLLLVQRPDQVWIAYAALLVESALGQLFDPAAQALVPAMVGRGPKLAPANALLAVVSAVSRLVGASFGGIVFAAWGLGVLVSIDAATYMASAASLFLLRWRPVAATELSRSDRSLRGAGVELIQGLRHLIANASLRGLLIVAMTFIAANGAFTALLVPYIRLQLHGEAAALGLLLAATGVGFLAGAPIGPALLRVAGLRITMTSSLLAAGIGFLLWFNTIRIELALTMAAVSSAAVIVFFIGRRTHMQALTPDPLVGRISAAFLTAEAAAMLAGTALGGGAAGFIGVTPTVLVAGGGLLASGVLAAILLRDPGPDPLPRRSR